jgi:hypothetical protein
LDRRLILKPEHRGRQNDSWRNKKCRVVHSNRSHWSSPILVGVRHDNVPRKRHLRTSANRRRAPTLKQRVDYVNILFRDTNFILNCARTWLLEDRGICFSFAGPRSGRG